MSEWLLDASLAALLLCMAWGALFARKLSAAIGLFIAFGLVLALIWARLGSADLAFAEAAIGAGLTGVLLLQAARSKSLESSARILAIIPLHRARTLLLSLAYLTAVSALLIVNMAMDSDSLFDQQPVLPNLVEQQMSNSGVDHPVTAVLLNFRSWDTLLELLVLLVALLGARQLYPDVPHRTTQDLPAAWPLMVGWARLLTPLLVLVGGYILWRGSTAPGGAFQAGAILASGAVLLRLTGQLPPFRWSHWAVRTSVCTGGLLFLMVAAVTAWLGEGWLVYPSDISKPLILLIELAATLSIAATLALLVIGDREDIRQ